MAIREDEIDDRNGTVLGKKGKTKEEELGISKIRARVLGMLEIVGRTIWKVGKNDKRRVIHALKVGVALTLVSLLYLMEPLFKGIGSNAMWAVMTVVVVLEFTAGATLIKGLNRGLGTLIAGSLAFLIEFIANRSGKVFRAVFIATAVFFIGFVATYIRFVPYIKRNYDYGVLIFLLTFNLITVSSFRIETVVRIARERLYTIAIGCGICLVMTLLFFPIWSGDDLHKSTVSKLRGLAHCIKVCVDEYFEKNDEEEDEEEKDPAEDQVYKGYRAVLDSKSADEALALYASWEPRHTMGCQKFPGKQYVKVGAVLRQFGYTVVALHGCLKTEIQTPQSIRALFKDPCTRLAGEVSKVLTELAQSIQNRRHCSLETLCEELHAALHDLNSVFKSQPKLFLFSNHQHGAAIRHHHQHQNEGVTPRTSAIMDFWRANKRTSGRRSNLNPETHRSRHPSPPHRNDHTAIHSSPETPAEGAPAEKKVLWPQQSRRAAAAAAVLTSLELAEALPFAAFASLLVDLVTRLDTVIEEVEELGRIAGFKKYDKDDDRTTLEVRCDKPPPADTISQNQLSYHGGTE